MDQLMRLKIDIDMVNLAFEGEDCGPEVARILRALADRCEDWSYSRFVNEAMVKLYDFNGNNVGKAEIVE